MTIVTKSLRLPEELIDDIENLHSSKEKYKKFSFSDYTRDALAEKLEKDKKEKEKKK